MENLVQPRVVTGLWIITPEVVDIVLNLQANEFVSYAVHAMKYFKFETLKVFVVE